MTKICKILFLVCCSMGLPCMVHAQLNFKTDSLNRYLFQYLQERDTVLIDQQYDDTIVSIWNLLSKKELHGNNPDIFIVGIYSFERRNPFSKSFNNSNGMPVMCATTPVPPKYALLKYFGEYTIIQLDDPRVDFGNVLKELLAYFDNHAKLERRLLPFYTKAICNLYVYNTHRDAFGMWYDFYDSDYKIYTGGESLGENWFDVLQ